jgi:hypothetical protein
MFPKEMEIVGMSEAPLKINCLLISSVLSIPNHKFPAYRQALNLTWYRAGRQIPNKLQIQISNDPPHPFPLPQGERGFRNWVIGIYLKFGAWDLMLRYAYTHPHIS